MILSITSLKIKNPFYMLIVPYYSLRAIIQLKSKSKCVKFKTFGLGLTSYTMTLWNQASNLEEYYRSGAHLVAMKKASKYAMEIRILRHQSDDLISWKQVKELLKNAKVLNF